LAFSRNDCQENGLTFKMKDAGFSLDAKREREREKQFKKLGSILAPISCLFLINKTFITKQKKILKRVSFFSK